MLNFNSNHASIEGNLDNKKGSRLSKKIIIGGLIVSNILLFSGCYSTVECDIQVEHAHYYINDDLMGRYIVSERTSMSGLDRLDNYIFVNEEDVKLINLINKNDLFKIVDNKEAIDEITATQTDYKEYRYKYIYQDRVAGGVFAGGKYVPITTYRDEIGYSWTSDPNKKDLTGEVRDCHYVYYGYKITKDDKGEYSLEKSEPVDNIAELSEGYDYIKEKFYDVVNLHNKNEVLDYEDGPEMEGEYCHCGKIH